MCIRDVPSSAVALYTLRVGWKAWSYIGRGKWHDNTKCFRKIWLETENSFPYRSSGKFREGLFQTTIFFDNT